MTGITFTDEQRQMQPLLEMFGIIMLPPRIENNTTYKEIAWALHVGRHLHPDKRLALHCFGSGGNTNAALAIVDLIQADGRVDGVLSGTAYSASSLIWAACPRRFVHPNAAIGVHTAIMHSGDWENASYRKTELYDLEWTDQRMIAIYAYASNKNKAWWRERLERGHAACQILPAKKLIAIEMARPIKERE